ncbi:DUF4252 domain-containing protein [Flammeovirgaceae bacterium SG7u.111]|nr:DUF4252 domain-containing protein [Flammeovirgaceae bacterium SG7u.132]WPO38182.1 DUF4252 domain-containing protein [Flammeovirgaceae bacterium SG7u.111]
MKKSAILLIMLCFWGVKAYSQSDAISTMFSKYEDDENFTKVSVTSKMFSLFTELEPEDEDDKALLEAISKIKGLKVLAADSIPNGKALYKEASAKVKKGNFEELMSVRDGGEDMLFMINEKDGVISELLMLVGGEKNFFILSLFGEIDLKEISKLSRVMKIKGMEKLGNMNKN